MDWLLLPTEQMYLIRAGDGAQSRFRDSPAIHRQVFPVA
jgi:hypothetical protein